MRRVLLRPECGLCTRPRFFPAVGMDGTWIRVEIPNHQSDLTGKVYIQLRDGSWNAVCGSFGPINASNGLIMSFDDIWSWPMQATAVAFALDLNLYLNSLVLSPLMRDRDFSKQGEFSHSSPAPLCVYVKASHAGKRRHSAST